MDIEILKKRISRRIAAKNFVNGRQFLNTVPAGSEIRRYLDECLTPEGVSLDVAGLLGADMIEEENATDVAPGGLIFPHGYCTIGLDSGGNALVVSIADGSVHFADVSSFADPVAIIFQDTTTKRLSELPWSPANVEKALIPLADNLETFLFELIDGNLNDKIEELG